MPTPAPYPTPGNGVPDSWECTTDVATSVQSCVVTHYALSSPAPISTVITSSGSPAAAPSAYPGGYAPGDTGNWQDIGPWFAALIAACVIGPFALKTFIRWTKEFFSHV